jgi:hypothetical protein
LSGTNISPNWHTTASNSPSLNCSLHMSVQAHSTPEASPSDLRATVSMGALRSDAISVASSGSASRTRRVTIPVPHAVSSTRRGASALTRSAVRRANGSNRNGPMPW